MYPYVIIGMNSLYFINSINEPISLINFIEKIDLVDESFPVISKWDIVSHKTFVKNISIDSEHVLNDQVSQKVLYIKNSLLSNINFCKNLYSEATGLDCGPLNDLSVYKKNPGSNQEDFKKDGLDDVINVYVILNSDPDSVPFCIDEDSEIYIRPESASIVMLPDSLSHKVGQNITSNTYYAKSSFKIDSKRPKPSKYIISSDII
jgi:hypothetical protein